ncbi:MAG: AtpZ/AtpI family protein [Hyphomicrobiaceae bacterium]|nr:AtpZ/AtpI family protein [Hyphomicrobiaceae bacterium]
MPDDGKPGHEPRGELSPEERAALERRSSELGRKLDVARQTGTSGHRPGQAGDGAGNGKAMGRAMRLSAELVAGVVVGGAIGWWLDQWLDNKKPWLFILFFLLGAAAGMLNLIRAAMREKTPSLPSVKDERDQGN